METITAYEDLARLVTGHFHRGVRTNTMVSPEEYGPAIAAGTLRAQATPAGLLLLRDRGDHTRLTFYLGDLTVPLGAELPPPTVTEVAFRPRDTGLRETVSYLTAQGFVPVLERLRLSRPAGETGETSLPPRGRDGRAGSPAPRERRESRLSSVQAFLQSNFSPLTGCLPNREELDRDLRQGRVLTLEEGGAITGLLHFSLVGNTGEIRHLAVRSDLRGTGRTRPLLDGYLRAIGGVKSVVWTRSDDLAAQTAYQRRGFVPDGRRSVVLCYPEKEGMKP